MISKRLLAVAKFVPCETSILDVGCDHGLLDIFLYKNKKNVKITAVDINVNAIDNALKNIEKSGLKDKISIKLSSGLEEILHDLFDTVIVAGMGGRKIVKLLEKDKIKNLKNIIIQANNNVVEVRKYLVNYGFYIVDESLVKDRGVIYTTIWFSPGKIKYKPLELALGPVLLVEKGELFEQLLVREIKNLEKIMIKRPNQSLVFKLKIKNQINKLRKIKG